MAALMNGNAPRIIPDKATAIHAPSTDKIDEPKYAKTKAYAM